MENLKSIFKIANDFFIGKYIEFFIEARFIGNEISRIHETDGKTKKKTFRDTEYGGYYFIDEKIVDKIIKLEFKNRDWYFHTLNGFVLKRDVYSNVKIVNVDCA